MERTPRTMPALHGSCEYAISAPTTAAVPLPDSVRWGEEAGSVQALQAGLFISVVAPIHWERPTAVDRETRPIE